MDTDELILQAIREVVEERIDQEVLEFSGEEPHVFSREHEKKMAKLIRDQKKPYFKLICTAGRRAACIAVVVILFAATALSVKAIREAVFDFITHIFSDHTVVTTESGADDGYPETIEEEYYISALPEGFEETENHKTNAFIKKKFYKENEYVIFKQYVKTNYSIYFDNDHFNYDEYIDNDDQKYMIITNEDDTTYIWNNGQYVFEITSNLDKNQVLELCRSTKQKQ